MVRSFGAFDNKHHPGLDILAPAGEPVLAMQAGEVVFAGEDIDGYGQTVIIRHQDELFSIYSYLSDSTVSAKQTVNRGQQIGAVGRPQVNHFQDTRALLHVELRQEATPIAPS